jgi:thioredoxin 2
VAPNGRHGELASLWPSRRSPAEAESTLVAEIVVCPGCSKKNRVPASAAGLPRCAVCHAALPWLVAVSAAADFDDAVRTSVPVLVDLWAPWCGPCRLVAPAVERAAAELAGRLKVVKVNVDEAPAVSERYAVQGIPTLLILRDGRVVDRTVGALPADRLLAWVHAVVDTA